MAPLVRTGGSRHTGLAALPHRNIQEAIKYLSEKDREILLMYFFLGMSDTEIGDRLKINRSTSFRSRKNSLEEIKKKLKENMNDE